MFSTGADIDGITKYKNPKWTCYDGAGGWHLISQESGVVKLVDVQNNQWAWQSLSHNSMTMDGSTLPGVSVTFTQGVGIPSFTPETAASANVLYAGTALDFSVTFAFLCNCPNVPPFNVITPVTKNYHISGGFWNAIPNQ